MSDTTDTPKQKYTPDEVESMLDAFEFVSVFGFAMLIAGILGLLISPIIVIILGLVLWMVGNYYGYKVVRDE